MKEYTKIKIKTLLQEQLKDRESDMKRVVLQGGDGKKEFEEYKRCVIALDDYLTFENEDEKTV